MVGKELIAWNPENPILHVQKKLLKWQKKWFCHQFYWFSQMDLRWFDIKKKLHRKTFEPIKIFELRWSKPFFSQTIAFTCRLWRSHTAISRFSCQLLVVEWATVSKCTNYLSERNSEFVNRSARIMENIWLISLGHKENSMRPTILWAKMSLHIWNRSKCWSKSKNVTKTVDSMRHSKLEQPSDRYLI